MWIIEPLCGFAELLFLRNSFQGKEEKNHKATGNFLKFINYTCKGNQEWTTKLSDKMLNQSLTFPHEKPLQLIYFAENWGTQT